jgi:hypothetical protein
MRCPICGSKDCCGGELSERADRLEREKAELIEKAEAEKERYLRKDVLLKAAYDVLKKCDESRYVLNAMSTTVHYDDAQCDGTCLMNDIAVELGIDDVAFIGEEE